MGTRDYTIGIDLGTSNSCVGVYRNGRVDIIANEQGLRLTPSFVAFNDEERLVGDSAKYQRFMNPKNTVYEVKRLIGRKCTEEGVQKYIEQWPYQVTNDGNENPVIRVEFCGVERKFTPEEISAMILEKMKEVAEIYIGTPVKKAVITVPAYFTDSQRQATIDAGTIAGLEVVKILNEPTAAAIAYGENTGIREEKNVLIFDFGGGTFDVSILTMKENEYAVKAISGNSDLGGADLDTRLGKYFFQEFFKSTGLDASGDPKSNAKVRSAAEQSKIRLSTQVKDRVMIENLYGGQDLNIEVTRTKFERLCDDLFKETIKCVDQALQDANLAPEDIDDVVLVGGSSWIPKILTMLKLKFKNKVKMTINPGEAVAFGAAVQAAMLAKDKSVGNLRLSDVTPHSLGKSVASNRMNFMIKRNSKIPAKCTKVFTTVFGHSRSLRIAVYEGESLTASENRLLGKFNVDGIELAPAGVPRIDVTFELNENGILEVSAVDRKTKGEGNIKITVDKGRLEKDDIERMITKMQNIKSDRFLEDASATFKTTIAKKKELLVRLKMSNSISKRGYMRLSKTCRDAEAWLEEHSESSKEEFDNREHQFINTFDSMLSRSNASL